jgi:hypothetical protein
VIIITNSDDGWVKYSSERYIPRLLPVIARYRIVSARTRYECFYPNQPLCWKAAAFAHEVNEWFESLPSLTSYSWRVGEEDDDEDDWQDSNACLTDVSSSSSTTSTSSDDDSGSENGGGDRRRSSLSSTTSSFTAVPDPGRRIVREVLSFGDSVEERTAVRIVAEQLRAVPKSVMFLSSPTPSQIVGQLTMLTQNLPHVCSHASSLDLEISLEQAERSATSALSRIGEKISHKFSRESDTEMLL